MAGPRPSRPGMPAARPLLNLGGGDKSGLAKAFQALVGGTPKTPSAEEPLQPESPKLAQALAVLKSLGFQFLPDKNLTEMTHPLAPDRRVVCLPPDAGFEPENFALDWAARHFPEMEFYLPFIVRRAALAKKSQSAHGRPTTPEPEYDEDGFLADYN